MGRAYILGDCDKDYGFDGTYTISTSNGQYNERKFNFDKDSLYDLRNAVRDISCETETGNITVSDYLLYKLIDLAMTKA